MKTLTIVAILLGCLAAVLFFREKWLAGVGVFALALWTARLPHAATSMNMQSAPRSRATTPRRQLQGVPSQLESTHAVATMPFGGTTVVAPQVLEPRSGSGREYARIVAPGGGTGYIISPVDNTPVHMPIPMGNYPAGHTEADQYWLGPFHNDSSPDLHVGFRKLGNQPETHSSEGWKEVARLDTANHPTDAFGLEDPDGGHIFKEIPNEILEEFPGHVHAWTPVRTEHGKHVWVSRNPTHTFHFRYEGGQWRNGEPDGEGRWVKALGTV